MEANGSDRVRLNLRKKLILVVLLTALGPLLIASGVSYSIARQSLEESALSTLVAVRDARARHVEDTYQTIQHHAISLAQDQMLLDATVEFEESLLQLPQDLGWRDENVEAGRQRRDAAEQAVRQLYLSTVAGAFEAAGGEGVQVEALVPTDEVGLAAQYQYLSANPNELGAKHLCDRPSGDVAKYGSYHAQYHPFLRDLKDRFGYYDLFLVDRNATVVYSVAKEIDFGTNLKSGPFRDSGLAEAVRKALASDRVGTAYVVDYAPYAPSFGDPASFIAAPLRTDDRIVGAVVLQMPIGHINEVMGGRAGLGQTGETYLVGRDRLMRSDSRFSAESTILSQKVDTDAVREALNDNVGEGRVLDYRGAEVLSAWRPLRVIGLDYALVAEKDLAEALAPARQVFWWMSGLAALLALVSVVVALRVSASLAAPVSRVTKALEGLAGDLLSDSQEQQAGATEQSAAVEETRQTFQGLLQASSNMNQIGSDVLGHAEISQRSAQTIGARIEDLSEHTAQIAEILTLVKDIANKSEILALNAALEGTKAGEAGRGFSLVAQQMQRLAEQVMGSVKRIEGLTDDITSASGGAVLAAEEAGKVSRLTTESAREISSAVAEQQSSAEQISVAMDEISQVAGRNVDAARKVVTSSNELLTLAEQLRVTVGARD